VRLSSYSMQYLISRGEKSVSQDNKDLLGMFVQCSPFFRGRKRGLVTKIGKLWDKRGGLAVGEYKKVPSSLLAILILQW
jgi:hypothetical protein